MEERFAEVSEAYKYIVHSTHRIDVCNMKIEVLPEHIIKLSEVISKGKPDLILVPWLLDTPVKHRLSNHMLFLASKNIDLIGTEIWGYQVHNHLFPNVAVDITNEINDKTRMLKAFASQKSKNFHHTIPGLNAFNSKYLKDSSYVELFFGAKAEDYLAIIDSLYSNRIENVYKGDVILVEQVNKLLARL